MKNLAILLIAMLAFAGCKNRNKAVEETKSATEVLDSINASNAMYALDFTGTYKGTIPCADCAGIEMTITIDKDGNFSRTMKYLGKDKELEYKDNGKYKWNAAGSIIELQQDREHDKYFVGENRLILLDVDGNIINSAMAELYVLTKLVAE